jgi:hypothetical protein
MSAFTNNQRKNKLTIEHTRKPLLVEIFKLIGVLVEGGAAWTVETIARYFATLKRLAIVLGVLSLCIAIIFCIAVAFNSQIFMTISLIVFSIMLMTLLIFAAPLLAGIAGFAEKYPSLRFFINLQASVALFFLIIGLAINIYPVSGKNLMVIIIGSMSLSLIWFLTGTKPDLKFLKRKIIFLIAFAIIEPGLAQQFPQIKITLRNLLQDLDEGGAIFFQINPEKIPIDTIAQFRAVNFFNPDGSAKVYYAFIERNGEYELFDRKGAHPTYSSKLKAVTPEIVKAIEKRLEGSENLMRNPERIPLDNLAQFRTIKFFKPDGTANIYYAFNENNEEYELFNRKGTHPTYNIKLKPVTPEVVKSIEKRLTNSENRHVSVNSSPPSVETQTPVTSISNSSTYPNLGTGKIHVSPLTPENTETELAKLTIYNQNPRAKDFYVEDTKMGTIPAEKSKFYFLQPGNYSVHFCMSGTSECGDINKVNLHAGVNTLWLPKDPHNSRIADKKFNVRPNGIDSEKSVSAGRYLDSTGCLREENGSFVIGFKSDCK